MKKPAGENRSADFDAGPSAREAHDDRKDAEQPQLAAKAPTAITIQREVRASA